LSDERPEAEKIVSIIRQIAMMTLQTASRAPCCWRLAVVETN